LVSSKDMQGRQKISYESYPKDVVVQPQDNLGAQSIPSAQTKTNSCEERRYQLLEEILAKENMMAALKRVEANKGAPGVDSMEVSELRGYLRQEWPHIKSSLLDGTYRPMPVRRAKIPKPDHGMRDLGIPNAVDRMTQQAIAQVIGPIFEEEFSRYSYGFRPGRKPRDAVLAAKEYIEQGYRWVVDIDIERFFDRVNHDMLMAKVAAKVKDKRVLKLIRSYLTSGVMISGVVIDTDEGTPQGGPLSPLLSNIMLDELDKELERRGHRFCRYADDCNIYLKSKRAAERVYGSMREFIEAKLKLKVNQDKSAVDRVWRRKFLGFSYYTSSKREVRLRLAPEVVRRQKDMIRKITKRSRGISVDKVIAEINQKMMGFINYFKIADMKEFLMRLQEWIRRKLRVIVWKHWKRMRTKFRKLIGMGLSLEQTKIIVYSRKKYWRLSNTPQLNKVMGIAFFEGLGLMNLVERYNLIR